MKKALLLALLVPAFTYAQSFGWFKQFKSDGGIPVIYNHDVSVNHNNEIVSCGLIQSNLASGVGEDFDPGSGTHDVFPTGVQSYNIWVSKLDSNGNYMWLSNFFLNNDGTGQVFAKQSSGGQVFVAGRFNQTADFDPGSGTFTMTPTVTDNGFYVKLNNDGSFAWAKQLTAITGQTTFSDIEVDNQGNLFLSGRYSSGGFLAKIDGVTGSTLWVKKFASIYLNFDAIALDKASNILILGDISSDVAADVDPSATGSYTISGTNAYYSDCPFVLKLDTGGNFIWAKVFNDYSASSGGNGGNPTSDIQTDDLNNIYVSGQCKILIDFDPSPTAVDTIKPKNNSTDIYVVSLDANGNHNWAKMYGGSGNDYTTRLLIGSNNDIFITTEMPGSSYDIDFDPGATTYTVANSNFGANINMALNHLTGNGSFVDASFFISNYSNDNDKINGLALTSGGSIIATGEYNVGNSGYNWVDFDPGVGVSKQFGGNIFILKLLNGSTDDIAIHEQSSANFNIYPNPAQNEFYIAAEINHNKVNSKLFIINTLGEIVYTQFLQQGEQTINISSLPAGSYFVKFENINGVVCKKLIKE